MFNEWRVYRWFYVYVCRWVHVYVDGLGSFEQGWLRCESRKQSIRNLRLLSPNEQEIERAVVGFDEREEKETWRKSKR